MKNRFFTQKAFLLTSMLLVGIASKSQAQDCYSSSGCSDYSNFGYGSTAATGLEYDNYVSGFHSTVVRDIDGTLKIWGEMTQADGVGAYLKPTPINPGNYPGLTGSPLKVAVASGTIGNVQFVMLTDDDKLWIWGKTGALVDESLTTNVSKLYDGSFEDITEFQEFSLGLPPGVVAADVKMMFATYGTLLITTCSGEVYFVTSYWGNSGSGSTDDVNVWAKVQKSTGAGLSDLTGIVAARGCPDGFIALDESGNLWTWGYRTWDGAGSRTHRSEAEQMILPTGASGSIKMVGMTGGGSGQASYYLLYEDGNLYTLGDNNFKQVGDWTTTNSSTWVQPKYTSASGPVMDDIKWISPQEHDDVYRNISVINEDKKIFNWGEEDKFNLGRGISGCSTPTASLDPGEPAGFSAGYDNTDIVSIETGGHVMMALRECESNFGYVGHRINGSMGDNSEEDECDSEFHFATSAIQVCGAEVVKAVLNASVDGPQYVGNTVTLLGNPSGGTYAISALSSATASLTDSVLVFTGAGTLRVDYTVEDLSCGTVTVSKTFNIGTTTELVTIPGTIWIDADGDAVTDAGEAGANTGMWANLTDPNGIVIASVKVNSDGTYAFEVSTDDLGVVGNYSVVLTADSRYSGDLLTSADTLTNGYEHTGTNLGGVSDVANKTGILSIGDLSTITTTTTTPAANFGIDNRPDTDTILHTLTFEPAEGSDLVLDGITAPLMSGSDLEDGDYTGNTGTIQNPQGVVITSLPNNGELWYFGFGAPVVIDASDVTDGTLFDDPSMFAVVFSGTGYTTVSFGYAYVDAAGIQDPSPATYTIDWGEVLPVSMLQFDAVAKNKEVLLTWTTASEVNNKGFEIERSATGNSWSSIGFVIAATADGNSTSVQNYSFTDSKPVNGVNYYRLKQIDVDGKFNYSSIRSVVMAQQAAIAIQPNPAKDHITVKGLTGTETIKIYSMHGRLVKEIVATGSTATIALDELAAGMYHVNVVSATGVVFVSKVIKL